MLYPHPDATRTAKRNFCRRRRASPVADNRSTPALEAKEGVQPSRWTSESQSRASRSCGHQSLQVGIETFLVPGCIRVAAAHGRGERDERGPNSCGWALSTAATHQRQRLLSAASNRRGNSYMSSLKLVITIARITSAERGGDGSSAMEVGGGAIMGHHRQAHH